MVDKIIKLWDELLYVKVNDGENVLVEREKMASLGLWGLTIATMVKWEKL